MNWGQTPGQTPGLTPGLTPAEAFLFFGDRWPSGLRRTPGKRVVGQLTRGFESRPVRRSYRA